MANNNIFDLSAIAGAIRESEKRPVEPVDQESSLIGYELVAPDDWKTIPSGSYIRYLRKDGSFRKGGIVQGVWCNLDKFGEDVIKIDISAGFSSQTTKWSITSNSVEKIWIKRPSNLPPAPSLRSTHETLEIKEDIEFCKDSIKQLTKEIQKIQSDQIRITSLLKKIIDQRRV